MATSMISNEGLAIEIKNLSVQIADLKALMASNSAEYLRKEVFELHMREYDTKIANIELEIASVKKDTGKANWRTHTITAVFTAILVLITTYAVNSFLNR